SATLAAKSSGAPEPPVPLARLSAKIRVDGRLGDAGWRRATKITTFYEINPGDNIEPPVKTTAWIAYDRDYLYVAFKCDDPNPSAIRAPFSERDGLSTDQDYVGVILDTRNTQITAQELFVNARGIESDGTRNDASSDNHGGGGSGSEDFSPDFFWDAAARITSRGWSAEFRIPMSSLRYAKADPQTWGIILFRNYPRDNRYQIMNVAVPRGSNCLLCRETELTGITGLTSNHHWVMAPYVTGHEKSHARGEPGSSFTSEAVTFDGGLDAKLTPNADNAVDLTVNPDFSQVESDVAQVSENQRFALFYSEKRPFFMEGVDLFQTPIQAVYTRTITSPRWGTRITGNRKGTGYTFLLTQDRGGGSVVLPGSQSSELLPQDFGSTVAIGRVRHRFGRSYLGFLVTDRENEGSGYNRVLGPDFQWNPNGRNQISGQYLFSVTQTPNRPDLSPQWDGRRLTDGGLALEWRYNTTNWNARTVYLDLGKDFRAQDGFVPQVGYRQVRQWVAHDSYPNNFITRVEPYLNLQQSWEQSGGVLTGRWAAGTNFQGKHDLFWDTAVVHWVELVGPHLFHFNNGNFTVRISPGTHVSSFSLEGNLGQQPDFENVRLGNGGTLTSSITLRPIDRLTLLFDGERDWLNIHASSGRSGRLYTATVARVKTLLNFTAKSYLRLIVQWVDTVRDPSLYTHPVDRRSAELQGSLLFSYRLNWQSVLYAGYGDDRPYVPGLGVQPSTRELFFKLSYAFQR
ncbi:MAG TPA: DUF5916 domain-containing protein, partial [Thermoanaerobaculia bacterium]|nr:DUF5916 domain-containing protein [Thermoanaerobaculia bacterium]